MEENKITLPMDVSKGVSFDFTVEGITEEQAKALLDLIQAYIYPRGIVMAGGFYSIAHMEEISKDSGMDWEEYDPDLLDMIIEDDISLDDLEEWEDDFDADGRPYGLSDYEY